MKDGATVWEAQKPSELLPRLRLELWHKMGMGPAKLHVRGKEKVGRRLLLAQPPFQAWFKRCARGRTQLIIQYKVVVMDEAGHITTPANCAYTDLAVQQTRETA
eukprot:1779749-Pleurochrysis_carterae.AAC.1